MADHEKSSENDEGTTGEKLRQLLHAATADRGAEAKALADRAGDGVSEADALVAVERAHGERRDEETEGTEIATVRDARAAAGLDDSERQD
jgi:hypothetical protein